jgi:hypothetical protein
MEELVQLLIWGFVLFAIAIRNASKKRQGPTGTGGGPVFLPDGTIERSDGSVLHPEGPGGRAVETADAAEPSPRPRPPARRSGGVARRSREGAEATARSTRKSLRERWAEMARELERQMQEQVEAAQRPQPPEETVNIPGRRVEPLPPAIRPSEAWAEGIEAAREIGDDELRRPAPARRAVPARPTVARGDRRRAPSGEGRLSRLDRYAPLRRAIILSEILGPPPGLGDGPAAPRRMWDD